MYVARFSLAPFVFVMYVCTITHEVCNTCVIVNSDNGVRICKTTAKVGKPMLTVLSDGTIYIPKPQRGASKLELTPMELLGFGYGDFESRVAAGCLHTTCW